ncbi:hypothetical protein C0989_009010 [Termitomyces sp. Mn162]|nr:hypothetical protein C0989_009010 [Termitomyces sp. Mn162]
MDQPRAPDSLIAVFHKTSNTRITNVTATTVGKDIIKNAQEPLGATVAVVNDSNRISMSGGRLTAVKGNIRSKRHLQTMRQYHRGHGTQARYVNRRNAHVAGESEVTVQGDIQLPGGRFAVLYNGDNGTISDSNLTTINGSVVASGRDQGSQARTCVFNS